MTDARPLFKTVPYDEYEKIKNKLDVAQKECIRIADLYRRDRDAFNHEIDRIMARLDSGQDEAFQYGGVISGLLEENQQLISENAELKEKLTKALQIPHTDNSSVIASLLKENEQLKNRIEDFQKRYND